MWRRRRVQTSVCWPCAGHAERIQHGNKEEILKEAAKGSKFKVRGSRAPGGAYGAAATHAAKHVQASDCGTATAALSSRTRGGCCAASRRQLPWLLLPPLAAAQAPRWRGRAARRRHRPHSRRCTAPFQHRTSGGSKKSNSLDAPRPAAWALTFRGICSSGALQSSSRTLHSETGEAGHRQTNSDLH